MPLPRFVEIDGRRYPWRDLCAKRRGAAAPPATQPILFEMRQDARPMGERNAAERYQAPSLFTLLDRNPGDQP